LKTFSTIFAPWLTLENNAGMLCRNYTSREIVSLPALINFHLMKTWRADEN
jgi:hypothetical protein